MRVHELDEAVRSLLLWLTKEAGIDKGELVECSTLTGTDLRLVRDDYALVRGPEVLVSCVVRGAVGQAFTAAPRGFSGVIGEVLEADLSDPFMRGVFYATASAIARLAGVVEGTQHCESLEAESCAEELAEWVRAEYGQGARVLHIGYQPGHVEALATLLRDNLIVTDLKEDNVWGVKHGRLVYDGIYGRHYIALADLVLLTASALVNGTAWEIITDAALLGKDVAVYGVSGVGALSVLQKHVRLVKTRFCPYGK